MDSSLESRCRLKNKLRIKQELIQLLAAYNVDAYTSVNAYVLAEQLLKYIEDQAKQNCRSSIWNDRHY